MTCLLILWSSVSLEKLNMYDFKKEKSTDSSVLFKNKMFSKTSPELMLKIKRKFADKPSKNQEGDNFGGGTCFQISEKSLEDLKSKVSQLKGTLGHLQQCADWLYSQNTTLSKNLESLRAECLHKK